MSTAAVQVVIAVDADNGNAEIGRTSVALVLDTPVGVPIPTSAEISALSLYTTTETLPQTVTWDGSAAPADIIYHYARNKVTLTLEARDSVSSNLITSRVVAGAPVAPVASYYGADYGTNLTGELTALDLLVDAAVYAALPGDTATRLSNPASVYVGTSATTAVIYYNVASSMGSAGIDPDRETLIRLEQQALDVFGTPVALAGVHKQNYDDGLIGALETAWAAAQAELAKTSPAATQPDIDLALLNLDTAFSALTAHDHQVQAHTHDTGFGGANGLTSFGQTVTIRVKGDNGDVTGLTINGVKYPLAKDGTGWLIYESGKGQIGTIASGSSIVTLLPVFTDRLTNTGGTPHSVVLTYEDSLHAGTGAATIAVNRTAPNDDDEDDDDDDGDDDGKGDDGDKGKEDDEVKDGDVNNGALVGAGEPISPQTGDGMNLTLWLVLICAAALMLLVGLVRMRRRANAKK
jgi:LPXTG-motif cell wall-anchored protein